jgi:hypothetical protein
MTPRPRAREAFAICEPQRAGPWRQRWPSSEGRRPSWRSDRADEQDPRTHRSQGLLMAFPVFPLVLTPSR